MYKSRGVKYLIIGIIEYREVRKDFWSKSLVIEVVFLEI